MKPIMSLRIRVALFAAVLAGFGATSFAATKTQVNRQMLMTTEALAAAAHDPSLVILQISRERTSYDHGHIPGARLVLLNQIAVSRDGNDNELPSIEQLKDVFESVSVRNGSRIILYDDAQGLLAARAYFTLDYLGLGGKAALLNGGMEKWLADGRALDRSLPKAVPSHIRTVAHPEVVVSYTKMREYSLRAKQLGSQEFLIDARSPQQFGSGILSNTKSGAGHIPGAHNVFWMNTLEGGAVPLFRSADEIQNMYTNAGLRHGGKVIVYCNSGIQAAHAYFTLKLLGYDAALYDGSFQDWIRHPNALIE
jgi:thiosulfate/3-mercaptopyruvate sulfurtransferase